MDTLQDRTIQVGPICARYWASGSHGSPVVLLHGLGLYVETWRSCIDALAFQHRVYAVDLPGFGRSEKPPDAPYDTAFFVQFVKGFVDALQLDHPHVIGHSLGGAVAAALALRHPKAVDRLVLVGAGALGRQLTPTLRLDSLPLVGERLTRPSRSGSAWMWQQIVYDPSCVPPELVEHDYEISILPHTQQAFLKTVRANINAFGVKPGVYRPLSDGLASLLNPVLLVYGRQDRIVPVAQAQAAARRLPDAQLQVFEHCGHCPMLEYPEAFHELVLDFLCS